MVWVYLVDHAGDPAFLSHFLWPLKFSAIMIYLLALIAQNLSPRAQALPVQAYPHVAPCCFRLRERADCNLWDCDWHKDDDDAYGTDWAY